MDISKLSTVVALSEEPKTVIIYQPSGEPYRGSDGKPSTITHTGPESAAYRAAKDKGLRRQLRARRTKMEPEDVLRSRIELAAAPVTAWTGWENGTTAAECTPQNVQALLRVEHILTQLEESVASHGESDFFTNAATSSLPSSSSMPS